MKEERYEEATKLKKELDSLRERLMKKLHRKINRQVLKMSIAQVSRLRALACACPRARVRVHTHDPPSAHVHPRVPSRTRTYTRRAVAHNAALQERKLQESPLARAQHALNAALGEEDYTAAARALAAVESEEARVRRRQGRWGRVRKVLDWAWMSSCIAVQVSLKP